MRLRRRIAHYVQVTINRDTLFIHPRAKLHETTLINFKRSYSRSLEGINHAGAMSAVKMCTLHQFRLYSLRNAQIVRSSQRRASAA